MEDSVLQRVKTVMETKSKNESDFARQTGISQRTVNNYVKLNREPSLSSVILILQKFTDISSDWLLLGKGSMYRTSATAEVIINGPQSVNGSNNLLNSPNARQIQNTNPDILSFLMNEVNELKKENRELRSKQ